MKKLRLFLKYRKIELISAAVYVGAGTLAICNVAGSDLLYGDWVIYTILITYPVTFISFIYRFAEVDYLIPVLTIQLIMFVLTFLFLCVIFSLFRSIFKVKKTN
ncbi:hypothetical protein HER18_04240 [Chryseobacterium sp. NEB161]|nr:hypothetical protein HER18_04240 [Chryseobacterium sp. NEB161]